ncbi:MAG: hypothetical protein EXS35_06350 [Pedosphaera sp.]|nr:hypothetical protein [Pedosphaera sp.]
MQINLDSSRMTSATLRALGRGVRAQNFKPRRAAISRGGTADDLLALAQPTPWERRLENAVWLTVAMTAAAVLGLSFSLRG